ncbi:MAG: hypothetical protein NT121_17645 [Chloroflexi bacterium]|nr:hypothetical protein [Chloroflexota bacterium]
MFKHIVFRFVAALVLLAAIAGIAFFAFNAGVTRGAVLNLPTPAAGQPVPYYGYGMMYPHFPFFGIGLFGLLAPLFLLFLAIGAGRRMLHGPRWGWQHMQHGPCGDKGPGNPDFVPPMFAEMHRRAHAADQPAGESDKK